MTQKHLYQIIEDDLRHKILNGELKQGELIPSEMELVAQYKVSRFTVRQAINNLLVDGYIYRHKGRGTFVTFNKKEMEQEGTPYFSFTKEMKNIDTPIETTLLSFSMIKARRTIGFSPSAESRRQFILCGKVASFQRHPVGFRKNISSRQSLP